jgi:uncharacterized membrane protein YjgN (DUF898 family)
MSVSTAYGTDPSPPDFSHISPARPEPRELSMRFTGSGSEYFRIWIVNLLLTLVTLSIYYPWAKVRRLRYFYGNTVVDGQPLGFHADPKKVLRGYLLVGVMLILYSVAARVSSVGGLVAFVIVAAIWPALLKSTMQFRLANTSWRGLRLRFTGDVAGAYRAMLPWFVPGFLLLLPMALLGESPQDPPVWYGAVAGLGGLALMVLFPLLWWNLKKYQHDHFAYGPLVTELRTGPGSFYGVALKTLGIALLAGVVVAIGLVAVAGASFGLFRNANSGTQMGAIVAIVIAAYVAMLLVAIGVRPYFTARMQNLLWSRTGNRSFHFNSALRFRSLFGLTLKNWLLVILTLGLYWPFAAVALARLRIESMSVTTRVDPQTLAADARAHEGEAAGDAAGDLFGLDIGF